MWRKSGSASIAWTLMTKTLGRQTVQILFHLNQLVSHLSSYSWEIQQAEYVTSCDEQRFTKFRYRKLLI